MVVRKNSMRIIDDIDKLILYTTDDENIEYRDVVLIDTDESVLVIKGTTCIIFNSDDISRYELSY